MIARRPIICGDAVGLGGTQAAAACREVKGQIGIWLIATATGLVSTLLTLSPATALWAPWCYATLPATIGLFAAKWRWSEPVDNTQN